MKVFRNIDLNRCDCELRNFMRLSNGTQIPISDGAVENISIMYNQNVISEQELDTLLKTSDYLTDPRIVCMSPQQADNLAAMCPEPRVIDIIRNMSDESMAIFLNSVCAAIDSNTIRGLVKNALRRKDDKLDESESEVNKWLQQKLV